MIRTADDVAHCPLPGDELTATFKVIDFDPVHGLVTYSIRDVNGGWFQRRISGWSYLVKMGLRAGSVQVVKVTQLDADNQAVEQALVDAAKVHQSQREPE